MNSSVASTHMIVLPGGGYAEHAPYEAEPVARWLGEIGVRASVFRYPLNVRHPAPLDALRAEIRRRREEGAQRIGLIGFSAGGHLAGLAALAPGAGPDETVQFAVLCYAITSMETETYRPARLILLGEEASPQLRRSTSLDSLVTPAPDRLLIGSVRSTAAHGAPGAAPCRRGTSGSRRSPAPSWGPCSRPSGRGQPVAVRPRWCGCRGAA